MGNCIIGTNRFTFSTFNAFFLINHRFSIFHGNSPSWTNFTTRMRNTSHTFICHLIFILRTCIAGRRNYLHQGRFIILFINVAFLKSLGYMNRCIFRPEGKPHSQTNSFSCNCTFPIDTVIFRLIIIHNFIWQCLHIIFQVFRMICKISYFFKNTSSVLSNLCINSSHTFASLCLFTQ